MFLVAPFAVVMEINRRPSSPMGTLAHVARGSEAPPKHLPVGCFILPPGGCATGLHT